MSEQEYERFVKTQFVKSRERLEKEFGKKIDMLAWPFGIYDDELIAKSREAGYIAAFTIEDGCKGYGDNPLKLPRHLLTNAHQGKRFEMIVTSDNCQKSIGEVKK